MRLPSIQIDSHILKLLVDISTVSKQIHEQDNPIELLHQLDRASILKSSLYSARIEGNELDEHTLESDASESKTEIFNLIDAVYYIRSLPERQPLNKEEILRLHAIVMRDLSADAGKFRQEQNAIFDTSGSVRYLPPPPIAMRKDLDTLVTYVASGQEFPLLVALTTHLLFEKIHPFIDGNGRVGRLLIPFIQKTYGEHFPLVVPFERYLEKHRDEYYRHLDIGVRGIHEYLLFMLSGIRDELQMLYSDIKSAKKNQLKEELILPDRQREILSLIREHRYLSMNMIQRRFLRILPRTIRYDVSVLIKKKLINKIGTTRGVVYEYNSTYEK